MKIVLLSREYPPDTAWGGVAIVYENMAVALAKQGHEVHVICQTISQPHDLIYNEVKIHRVGTNPKRYSALARINYSYYTWLKLRELIRNDGIEIVCASHWGAEGLLCSLFERVPLVITAFTSAQGLLKTKNYSGKREYLNLKTLSFFENFTVKRATRVIANSQSTYASVINDMKVPQGKVDIIHHAIDTTKFNIAQSSSTMKQDIGIGDKEQLVLCVGRLEHRKGTHILCDAIEQILSVKPSTKFLFVGKDSETAPGGGSFKEYLTERASEHNFIKNLIFIESVPQEKLIELYQICDVYVSPSLQESFGLTVVEAMACGKPVVATPTGIVPELQSYGLKGLKVVPSGDATKLSEAVLDLLSTDGIEIKELYRINRNILEREFSVPSWIDKTIRNFQEALKE